MTKEFYYPISGNEIERLIFYAEQIIRNTYSNNEHTFRIYSQNLRDLKTKIKERNVVDIEGFND